MHQYKALAIDRIVVFIWVS